MELAPASSLIPSTYNPRTADASRLEVLEISIRKLGFVLPLYATYSGEIISGHQRHLVATERLGYEVLPVERLEEVELQQRMALNILFNRATNDMSASDHAASLTERLTSMDIAGMAEQLPDVPPDVVPCANAEMVPIGEIPCVDLAHARRTAAAVIRRGVEMPIVVDESGEIVNGRGAYMAYAGAGRDVVPVVRISDAQAELARAVLNLLTMDFTIEGPYRDILRHNAFRRKWQTRAKGCAVAWQMGVRSVKGKFDPADRLHAAKWRAVYGNHVLDFGAGKGTDARMGRQMGARVTEFEPFTIGDEGSEVDPEKSRRLAREFLEVVASGAPFDSIIMSAILNSVPFDDDRRIVLTIVTALASPSTNLWATQRSVGNPGLSHTTGKTYASTARRSTFLLANEPNTILGDYTRQPKVQRFFTADEVDAIIGPRWEDILHLDSGVAINVRARKPRPVSWEDLEPALEFEFDLPYADGSRMGLVDEAKQAFRARLAIDQA